MTQIEKVASILKTELDDATKIELIRDVVKAAPMVQFWPIFTRPYQVPVYPTWGGGTIICGTALTLGANGGL